MDINLAEDKGDEIAKHIRKLPDRDQRKVPIVAITAKVHKEDIKNFKLIYNLVKERGFTLEGAKQKLKKNPAGLFSKQEIISRLEIVKAELQKIKNQL